MTCYSNPAIRRGLAETNQNSKLNNLTRRFFSSLKAGISKLNKEKLGETRADKTRQTGETSATGAGNSIERTGSINPGSVQRNYRSVDGSWDSKTDNREEIEGINELRARVNIKDLKKNGQLVRVFTNNKSKKTIYEIKDPELFLELVEAGRKDMNAINPGGVGGGGLTRRPASTYAPPARTFVSADGAAFGVVGGDMIKTVGASPYFKGNFSSLFKALRASGGTVLDAHFGDATPGIYPLFGMYPAAICKQELGEMRPDWNPIHALQEFPHGTRLHNPQGDRVKLEVDENGIGQIPPDALDDDGKIRPDWKVYNYKVFMYAKEGDKYTGGFSDDDLEKLQVVDNVDQGYAVVRELYAADQAAKALQRAAESEANLDAGYAAARELYSAD